MDNAADEYYSTANTTTQQDHKKGRESANTARVRTCAADRRSLGGTQTEDVAVLFTRQREWLPLKLYAGASSCQRRAEKSVKRRKQNLLQPD